MMVEGDSRLSGIGLSLGSLYLDGLHLFCDLGRDRPVSDQSTLDLVDSLLLLGSILDLNETESLGSSEPSTFSSGLSETSDDLGGLDVDREVGEDLG